MTTCNGRRSLPTHAVQADRLHHAHWGCRLVHTRAPTELAPPYHVHVGHAAHQHRCPSSAL
jgi:hypothetical protein